MNILQQLQTNPLRVWLPEELAILKRSAHVIRVDKGCTLFHEETNSDCVYYVESGYVKLFRTTGLGNEVTVSIHKPSEFIGTAGVLLGEPHIISAEAMEKSAVWKIARADFIALLYAYPQLAIRIAAELSTRVRHAATMIMHISAFTVERRLAMLMLNLAVNTSGAQVKINIRLTHQELANMIGASRQTVSIVLGQLKRRGFIKISRQCIELLDINALRNI